MATDNFNRANNNGLGADWTEDEVTATDLRVLTNELMSDDNGGADHSFAFWNTDVGGDHFSELEFRGADLSFIQPQSGPAVRIPTSATRASFTGYVALCDPSGQAVSLRKYVSQALSGGGTVLADATGVTFTAGDVFKIEAIGSAIKVYKTGNQIISVVDTAITGGRPGVVQKQGYLL